MHAPTASHNTLHVHFGTYRLFKLSVCFCPLTMRVGKWARQQSKTISKRVSIDSNYLVAMTEGKDDFRLLSISIRDMPTNLFD